MGTKYFVRDMTDGLEDACYPQGKDPPGTKNPFHFDNVAMYTRRTILDN
jgi:hypothetical protein